MVMGNSKNLRVFNFAILLKSPKFDDSIQQLSTISTMSSDFTRAVGNRFKYNQSKIKIAEPKVISFNPSAGSKVVACP